MKTIMFGAIFAIGCMLCDSSAAYAQKLCTEPIWLKAGKTLSQTTGYFLFQKVRERKIRRDIYEIRTVLFSFDRSVQIIKPWKIWGYDREKKDFNVLGHIPEGMRQLQNRLLIAPASLHDNLIDYVSDSKLFIFYIFEKNGEELSEQKLTKLKLFPIPPTIEKKNKFRIFKREQLSSIRFVSLASYLKALPADYIWPCVYFDETGYAFMVYDKSREKPKCIEIPQNPFTKRISSDSTIPKAAQKYTTIGEVLRNVDKSTEEQKGN